MSVLCHFVLDNERIHHRLLHIIQTGREGALRSLKEQIKELHLKLRKVIGCSNTAPSLGICRHPYNLTLQEIA